ncbi:hypothetical protein P7C70_g2667, partial [Phenoliferia sp. Uapishka_3]
MLLPFTVALLASSSLVSASLFMTAPVAATTITAGKSFNLTWLADSGASAAALPLASAFGPCHVGLYTGSASAQTEVQQFGTLPGPETRNFWPVNVDPTVGPDSDLYFFRIMSLSAVDATGSPLLAFSARFTESDSGGIMLVVVEIDNFGWGAQLLQSHISLINLPELLTELLNLRLDFLSVQHERYDDMFITPTLTQNLQRRLSASSNYLFALLSKASSVPDLPTRKRALAPSVLAVESNNWVESLRVLQTYECLVMDVAEREERLEVNWKKKDWRAVMMEEGSVRLTAREMREQWMREMHLFTAVNGDPDEMVGLAVLANDDFRAAFREVSEKDVETEGEVLAALADFQRDIIRSTEAFVLPSLPISHLSSIDAPPPSDSARNLYLTAIQLGASLSPYLPTGAWYLHSKTRLEEYRRADEAKEHKALQLQRGPIMETLSAEMEELEGLDRLHEDNEAFVKAVVAKWPSRKPDGTVVNFTWNNATSAKKNMLKCVTQYHPDHQIEPVWKIHSEEVSLGRCLIVWVVSEKLKGSLAYAQITKVLNGRYSSLKI